jgi:hypothetical protein
MADNTFYLILGITLGVIFIVVFYLISSFYKSKVKEFEDTIKKNIISYLENETKNKKSKKISKKD